MPQKISQRPAHTSQVASTDTFVMNVGGTTKRVAPEFVRTALGLSNAYTALTDAATTVWAYSANNKLKTWTIGGNRTLSLTGTADGDGGVLFLIQDGTGGRVPTLPGNKPAGSSFSSAAGQVDLLTWTNRGGVIWWDIINYGTVASGNITPAAPTGGVVDDAANTFTFTLSSGYAASDHEYSINGGAYQACSSNVISVGNTAIPVGSLLVRVKAATGRNASPTLSNAQAFTASSGVALTWAYNNGLTEANGGLVNNNATGTHYARSTQTFSVGNRLEFVITDATNIKDKFIGLGTNQSPAALADVLAGLYIYLGGQVWKAEAGNYSNTSATVGNGDKLAVVIVNTTTVRYEKFNGSTWDVIGSTSGSFSGALNALAAIEATGALNNINQN